MKSRSLAATVVLMVLAARVLPAAQNLTCPQTVFGVAATSPASRFIQDLATGDFNDDGIPDVVAGANQGGIYVLLGRADGTLSLPLSSSDFFGSVERVVPGKFDGDDNLDVVGGTYIRFLKGNGDGTFEPPVFAGLSMESASAADVNGDGKLDLVGTMAGSIAVLLGNGDGTFQPAIETEVTPSALAVAVADVVGDSALDAVVGVSDTPSVQVFPGQGDGHFGPPQVLAGTTSSRFVALSDLDGDGHTDVVVDDSTAFPAGLGVFLNRGSGVFDGPTLYPANVFGLLAADLDDDGHPDLVIPSYGDRGPGMIRLLFGRGDGTFDPPADYVGGDRYTPTVALDSAGTGLPDLVFPTFGAPTVSILDNRGERSFAGATVTSFSPWFTAFVSGDFDEDGTPDLAGAIYPNNPDPNLFLYRGDGNGRFNQTAAVQTGEWFRSLQTGQFSPSGHLDLLAEGNFGLFILPGNGDGTFGDQTGVFGYISGTPPAVADLNGDGIDDIVALASGTFLVSFISGGAQTDILLPGYPGPVTAGKFDGDAYSDLAVTIGGEELLILLGNGDGSFREGASYPADEVGRLATGDVDGDGHTDVLAARPFYGTLLVFLGHGDGTFASRQVGLGSKPLDLEAADLDGDGLDDVITGNSDTGDVSALIARPGGTFQEPFSTAVGQDVVGVQAIDLTGDGRRDVLAGMAYGVVSLINEPFAVAVTGGGAVIVGSATSFLATSSSGRFGSFSYQWRKGGVPLTDGGPISGATTAMLTIDPVSFDDPGSYDVVVTDDCGEVTSNPAALSVEFADVPTSSPFHDDILTIATEGITGGCGGGNYCPTSSVRRDQMAAFLLKSEHGSDYTPPPCTGVFDDVPCPGPFTDWVEQLAAEGVTGGCGVDIYCPSQSVTRAQMAIFLLKTSEGSGYAPPPATGIFGDVPVGSFGADFIEDLYGKGITGGCSASPLLYCPDSTVLRQQMATFLVRTFQAP